LEERLRRLKTFTQLAEGLVGQWEQQLQSLPSPTLREKSPHGFH